MFLLLINKLSLTTIINIKRVIYWWYAYCIKKNECDTNCSRSYKTQVTLNHTRGKPFNKLIWWRCNWLSLLLYLFIMMLKGRKLMQPKKKSGNDETTNKNTHTIISINSFSLFNWIQYMVCWFNTNSFQQWFLYSDTTKLTSVVEYNSCTRLLSRSQTSKGDAIFLYI